MTTRISVKGSITRPEEPREAWIARTAPEIVMLMRHDNSLVILRLHIEVATEIRWQGALKAFERPFDAEDLPLRLEAQQDHDELMRSVQVRLMALAEFTAC